MVDLPLARPCLCRKRHGPDPKSQWSLGLLPMLKPFPVREKLNRWMTPIWSSSVESFHFLSQQIFLVFLLPDCQLKWLTSFHPFSLHWPTRFVRLLELVVQVPIVCPAISTPCSLCSSCTSRCLDSCSICPSCMTLSFKSWSCASVIGRTSQGTLLPEPQLRYHFHKLCLANLQRHLFSNCAARSWAKIYRRRYFNNFRELPYPLLHKNAFPHRRFYTQTLLHTDPFTHRCFYTQTLLHTDAFTQRPLYTQAPEHTDTFTHRRFWTQTLLHTDAFTHKCFYTKTLLHTDAFTHRHFYTQMLFTHRFFYTQTLWHKYPFTHRRLYTFFFTHRRYCTQTPLHTNALTHRRFWTQMPFTHAFTQRPFDTQTLLHTDAFARFWRSTLISCERVVPDNSKWQFYLSLGRSNFISWEKVEFCGASVGFQREIGQKEREEGKREKTWRCEDVKCRWEDEKMRRCEDEMWTWEDVMARCEDMKMYNRPPLLEEPFAQTLSGKKPFTNY